MHAARLQRLQALLTRAGLDAVALIAGPNLYYLTGLAFHLSERPTVGFFPAHGTPVFVVGKLEESKVTANAPYPVKVFSYTDAEGPQTAFRLAAPLVALPQHRLSVETRRMRVMELRLIETAFHQPRIDAAEGLLAELRMAKDAAEIALMREAVHIAEAGLRATLATLRVGQTEREIAAELAVQLLRAGADTELPFSPSVASGPNSALPHAFITDRAIQAGDLLTLDWGVAKNGYCADLTRTFAVGEIDPELKRIYDLVLAANAAARATAKAGLACAEVDAAARKVITEGGYGEYFTHRVGHGLGLELHEDPSMHGNNETSLAPGFTFTIEPGIYLPGRGGVRIEDDVVITAAGCETLSAYPRELQVIGG